MMVNALIIGETAQSTDPGISQGRVHKMEIERELKREAHPTDFEFENSHILYCFCNGITHPSIKQ
jgi:hypothetical protein